MIEQKQKLDIREDNKYEFEVICNSKLYVKEATGQLLRFYYLVS